MEKHSSANVLMVGTGEYTTGYVHGKASASDKKLGVIGLTIFDLRSEHRGSKVNVAKMVGTNGTRFPGIREHFARNIAAVYKDMPIDFVSFPADDVPSDPTAFINALDSMQKGDLVTICTPDDTHYEIAKQAITRGLHVLITKPPVKTLREQLELAELAKQHNVLVTVEYHKRFDPMYSDARERIRGLGDFSYFNSFMSQPKFQLETFKAWAGKSSDISYYLNSHHIDIHAWSQQGRAVPVRVVAMKCNGVATAPPHNLVAGTEDTITLMVQWRTLSSGTVGTAVYTSSWISPKSDTHTQQRFHYMGHRGDVTIDQAHRGYYLTTDDNGMASVNPLYMKYTTDSRGRFAGQFGYGYRSIEATVDAVNAIRSGHSQPADYEDSLPTIQQTSTTTAILEAGRRSLDNNGRAVLVITNAAGEPVDLQFE
eukprot:TRINITY_DN9025_c0_g1_i1.p1 TRINITY_DN9025_c0_g1~~TRINITY_DN9025_c0_g1_i1.p1  ORF type:complete len:426 (-),score=112.56 TRINITY_DN9025_c0_g1_i1:224-1501(-)